MPGINRVPVHLYRSLLKNTSKIEKQSPPRFLRLLERDIKEKQLSKQIPNDDNKLNSIISSTDSNISLNKRLVQPSFRRYSYLAGASTMASQDYINLGFKCLRDINNARAYLEKHRNIRSVEKHSTEQQETSTHQTDQTDQSSSSSSVKYGIGQVIRHRKFGYRGVIYGWDTSCQQGEEWIEANGVEQHKVSKPFYHVLADIRDRPLSPITYVSEENIELIENLEDEDLVLNRSLTILFRDFDNGRYLPRDDLYLQYPLDHEKDGYDSLDSEVQESIHGFEREQGQ
eukprot:gb/GECH01014519.1/.p1 GENE.gb/GECH01014519.1/~~gb/GECH01014519.1/.p1  ORF type:complete len:286 (+),score=87.41 gb/GECH01014519.1/:1-858(+)